MALGSIVPIVLAVAAFFFAADLVYVVDHYWVHHDRERYARRHARHHDRYAAARRGAAQLDATELWTYTSAALISIVIASGLTLVTGNVGFALGAVLKYVHSLLFHLYQHAWWSEVPIDGRSIPAPRRGFGLATARYHAFHHAHPRDAVFAYAESWQGFDRILERLHPWLFSLTPDGRRAASAARVQPS